MLTVKPTLNQIFSDRASIKVLLISKVNYLGFKEELKQVMNENALSENVVKQQQPIIWQISWAKRQG